MKNIFTKEARSRKEVVWVQKKANFGIVTHNYIEVQNLRP